MLQISGTAENIEEVSLERLEGKSRFLMNGVLFVEVVKGDITDETTDAIVNAANGHLSHGAGVAKAISKKGGPSVQVESSMYVSEHGTIPTGEVATTGPGNLQCRFIIHAVGPMWDDDKSEKENYD